MREPEAVVERFVEGLVHGVPGSVPRLRERLSGYRPTGHQFMEGIRKEEMPCARGRAHVLQAFHRGQLPGAYLKGVFPAGSCLSVQFGHLQLELLLALQETLLATLLRLFPLLLSQQRFAP